ncbi:MAG: hypothetical protein AB7L65_08805 [Hyphomonadaceae bacterium]
MSRPRLERALFWTMAVAAFTAALACLGARAADRAAGAALDARQSYVIVRVRAPEGTEGLSAAALALGADARVASVNILSQDRAAALLQRWSRQPVQSAELPPLRLLEVRLTPPAARDAAAPAGIAALLANAGIVADAVTPPPDPAAPAAERLRRAAAFGALALSGVMALIVALAARGLAARRADFITVLADIGGRRGDACLPVADEAGGAGFLAGALGALAAGAAALMLTAAVFPGMNEAAWRALIAPADLAPLLAAPFVAAFAAGLGARWGAEALYARAAKLA